MIEPRPNARRQGGFDICGEITQVSHVRFALPCWYRYMYHFWSTQMDLAFDLGGSESRHHCGRCVVWHWLPNLLQLPDFCTRTHCFCPDSCQVWYSGGGQEAHAAPELWYNVFGKLLMCCKDVEFTILLFCVAQIVMIWISLSCFDYYFCLFIVFVTCLILFIVIIFHSQILSVIMHSCSPVTSLCFCVIWAQARPSLCLVTLRSFPDSWHFLNASFVARFLGFPLLFLIYIVINSPVLCSS